MRHTLLRFVTTAFLAVFLIAATSSAQTTHTVDLNSFTFSPDALNISVGDTVDWVWQIGNHSVESGIGGIPDGAFNSGLPVLPPMTFSVIFDQAFLDANPMTGNLYDYYCIVHIGFGMTGTIRVGNAVPALPTWGLFAAVAGIAGAAAFVLKRRRA